MIKNIKNNGFTLIELMVVVSIVAILTLLAGPSMKNMIEKEKMKTAANSLNNGIQTARSEALKKNRDVIFTMVNAQWQVMDEDDLLAISQNEINETIIQNTTPGNASSITFNNMGMVTANEDKTATIREINLTSNEITTRLRIIITSAGGSRVCNPDETSNTTSMIGC